MRRLDREKQLLKRELEAAVIAEVENEPGQHLGELLSGEADLGSQPLFDDDPGSVPGSAQPAGQLSCRAGDSGVAVAAGNVAGATPGSGSAGRNSLHNPSGPSQLITPGQRVVLPRLPSETQATPSLAASLDQSALTPTAEVVSDVVKELPKRMLRRMERVSRHSTNSTSPLSADNVVLLLTGSTSHYQQMARSLAARCGGTVTTDFDDLSVTHVITAATADGKAHNRTFKFMQAIAGGKWVVSEGWLAKCSEEGTYVPEAPFEIIGDDMYADSAPRRARAAVHAGLPRLLADHAVCLPGQFESVRKSDLEDLVRLAGGTVIREDEIDEHKKRLDEAHVVALGDPSDEAFDWEGFEADTGLVPLDLYWLYDSITDYRLLPQENFVLGEDIDEDDDEEEGAGEAPVDDH